MKTITFLTAIAISLLSDLSAHALTSFNGGNFDVDAGETFNDLITVNGISGSNALSVSISGSSGNLDGLSIYLQNPIGSKTLLLATELGSGTFSSNVNFSDSSILNTINTNPSPYDGTFLPFDFNSDTNGIATISTFSDFSPNSDGTWRLIFDNSFGASTVSIGQTTLTFDTTPVPFEFNPASGLLILSGTWLVRKALKNKGNKG